MDDDDEYYEYYYRRQHEWTLASFLAFFLVVFIRYAIPRTARRCSRSGRDADSLETIDSRD